jgi:UDP-N-acetylglucosamine acyltransferase
MIGSGIHPTALVDSRARIGARVTIGAFSIVGPDVMLADDTQLGHHVILEGRVEIGSRAQIGHGAVLGGVPQDLKFKAGTPSGVRVGADTVVREYVTVHRATRADAFTEIGRQCLIMALSHVAHDCRLGNNVIVINYAGITGHCDIGDRVTIGGLVGIVPFTRIGEHAYVGGMAKVNADVPPYMLVEGQPATARGVNVVGLRRAGIGAAERRALRDAYRILYRSGLAPRRALERLREEMPLVGSVKTLVEFIEGGKRPIVGGPRGAGDGTDDAVSVDAEEAKG